MQELIEIAKSDKKEGLRYRLYSAHDTNVANIMKQIAPGHYWEYIPYASNIYMELHKFGKELFVQVKFDGVAVRLDACSETMCPLSDFLKSMGKVLYQGDLKDACFAPPPPPFLEDIEKAKFLQ